MKTRNIIRNMYFNTSIPMYFKDMFCVNGNYPNIFNRKYYRIVDNKKYFESDFEEGVELQINRISENGQYWFGKYYFKGV